MFNRQTNKGVRLYGAERCHKTKHYQKFLQKENIKFTFIDVEENHQNARECISLSETKRLCFPTFLIDSKKLRNPSDQVLIETLQKHNIK